MTNNWKIMEMEMYGEPIWKFVKNSETGRWELIRTLDFMGYRVITPIEYKDVFEDNAEEQDILIGKNGCVRWESWV
jgi:hypothetical protein